MREGHVEVRRMRRVKIVLPDGTQFEANHARKLSELIDGLFADPTVPLLMEIPFLLRGISITTKPRGEKSIPMISIVTFDRSMRRVSSFGSVMPGSNVKTTPREKWVLEIPEGCGVPIEHAMRMERLRFAP